MLVFLLVQQRKIEGEHQIKVRGRRVKNEVVVVNKLSTGKFSLDRHYPSTCINLMLIQLKRYFCLNNENYYIMALQHFEI